MVSRPIGCMRPSNKGVWREKRALKHKSTAPPPSSNGYGMMMREREREREGRGDEGEGHVLPQEYARTQDRPSLASKSQPPCLQNRREGKPVSVMIAESEARCSQNTTTLPSATTARNQQRSNYQPLQPHVHTGHMSVRSSTKPCGSSGCNKLLEREFGEMRLGVAAHTVAAGFYDLRLGHHSHPVASLVTMDTPTT
jgi:hypothetical protein